MVIFIATADKTDKNYIYNVFYIYLCSYVYWCSLFIHAHLSYCLVTFQFCLKNSF